VLEKIGKSEYSWLILALCLLIFGLYIWLGRPLVMCLNEAGLIHRFADWLSFREKPVAHYLGLADRFVLLFLAGVCLLWFLWIISRMETKGVGSFIVYPPLVIMGVYFINVHTRIYSIHGFIHSGIVYRILSGQIPPTNPFLAGQPLLYPWGYHSGAALICSAFNISPFYAFNIINLASLIVVMVLIYRIAGFVFSDISTRIMAVIISLFGTTILTVNAIRSLGGYINIPLEYRGAVPVLYKFIGINGVPVGLMFYCIFLLVILRLSSKKKCGLEWAVLAVCALGVGFFYPAMLFGLYATALAVALFWWTKCRHKPALNLRKRALFLLLVLGGSALALIPYLKGISSGLSVVEALTSGQAIIYKVLGYFILMGPLLVVIYLNRKCYRNNADFWLVSVLAVCVTANFAVYILLNLPTGTEYKALILSSVTLGIVAAAPFVNMISHARKPVALLVLALFLIPSGSAIHSVLGLHDKKPPLYREEGQALVPRDSQQKELYQWIRTNSSPDSVFIDSDILTPILGRRSLFIAPDKWSDPGFSLQYLRDVCRYDNKLLRSRKEAVLALYQGREDGWSMARKHLCLPSGAQLFIVWRYPELKHRNYPPGTKQVFQTSGGMFSVLAKETEI